MDDKDLPFVGNPGRCFVTGNDQENFVYEPGPDPYIIQYYEQNASGHGGYVPMTGMVFAKDEEHARKIVADMLDFMDACHAKYAKHLEEYEKKYGERYTSRAIVDSRVGSMAHIRGMKLRVKKADRSQVFKVDWSDGGWGFA